MDIYEQQEVLSQYLLFHFGTKEQILPYDFGPEASVNFASRCIEQLVSSEGERALDVGCSVGRSSFELSKKFKQVIGIDYSENFIKHAKLIRDEKKISIKVREEGDNFRDITVELPEAVKADNITFEVGDAQKISQDYADFDLVFAANLLCRLNEPLKFLDSSKTLVKKGGKLVLVSPYSWLEDYTVKQNWLSANGSTEEFIIDYLRDSFSLEDKKDMPFLIREHLRKYQWGVSQALVFIRK